MTKIEAMKLAAMLIAAWPHTKALPQTVEVYEMGILHLDQAVALKTFHRMLATRNYLPSVAEFLHAAAEIERGPVRAGGEGWGEVRRAIGRYGVYRVPGKDFSFADDTVTRCVDALGWANLCNSENESADRARFIELYDKLAKGSRTEHVAAQLGGSYEQKRLERSAGVTSIADAIKRLPGGKDGGE